MSEALNIDGVEVYIEGEAAESIVMIHGWPDSYRLWDAQVEALKSQYRCVRFTLPGFDARKASKLYSLDQVVGSIRRIVEQTCPGEQVTLMLHDWGCFFGYQYAMRNPQCVSRIVGVDIGDAGSKRNVAAMSFKAKAQVVGYQVWLALAWRAGGAVGDAMARWMAKQLRCPAPAKTVRAQMGYPYYVQWAGALGGYSQARYFEPVRPMLFIYGRKKPFMFHSAHWVERMAERAGCKALGLDTGHWVMLQKPAEFNAAVQAWLTATPVGVT